MWFYGSEVASTCRELGLDETVTERSATLLIGALGAAAGTLAGQLQRAHGIDLRCNVTVMALKEIKVADCGKPISLTEIRSSRRSRGCSRSSAKCRMAAGGPGLHLIPAG